MVIYIASSWKNQHAVEMLTEFMRQENWEVLSFVENNNGEFNKAVPFEQWVNSDAGEQTFDFDIKAINMADVLVYLGPSGHDAWAEVGYAFGTNTRVLGLVSKGDQIGLMRKMVEGWFTNYRDLLNHIKLIDNSRKIEEAALAKAAQQ